MKARVYFLPILSGILIGTSYIPFPPWAVAFCYAPLWIWWLKQESWKRIWWGGWCTQFIYTLIGFNWVAHTVHEFGHLPWPVALLALALYSCFANLQVPLAGLLAWFLARKLKIRGASTIGLYAGASILTEAYYPMIFEWHMGYVFLAWHIPMAQVAELIGFRGLSAITYLINGGIALLLATRPIKVKAMALASTLLMLFAGLNGLGYWLKNSLKPTDQSAKVLLIQANIGNLEKQQAEKGDYFRQGIIDTYLEITRTGLRSGLVDFVVWPETAFPHFLNEPYFSNSEYGLQISAFTRDNNTRLITGGYGYDMQTEMPWNSLYLIDGQGTMTDRPYSKTHLLAFGEYVPGANWFPFLQNINQEIGSFARGTGASVRKLDQFIIGPSICYEGLFDWFSRELAQNGAQLFVNVTNDSWYGKWEQPYQHMYMTLARSVEFRRPVIRSTNTGFTTVALATGQILERSPLHEPWQHIYDVPYYSQPPKTVFMGIGYYFSVTLALLMILAGFIWNHRGTS